jgi:hypothetical protein
MNSQHRFGGIRGPDFLHNPHHLVPRDNRIDWRVDIPLDNMEVGVAYAAGADFQKNLPRPGYRTGLFDHLERMIIDWSGGVQF